MNDGNAIEQIPTEVVVPDFTTFVRENLDRLGLEDGSLSFQYYIKDQRDKVFYIGRRDSEILDEVLVSYVDLHVAAPLKNIPDWLVSMIEDYYFVCSLWGKVKVVVIYEYQAPPAKPKKK